jgi:tetratricopeptide (TPR) repeat protein
LTLKGIPSGPSDSGSILLNEEIISVDEQARRVVVYHEAYRTLTDAAVKDNSDDVIRFRKREQQAYLIQAETIQPDGTRQAVKADAVLIQSPQRQAEYSLYDDQSEMKIIFPNVKPGSVTHFIVVVQDLVAKIPGEFNQSLAWGASWATGLLRFRLEMPAEMGSRLKIETIGSGVPVALAETLPGNRISRTWTLSKLAGRRYEIDSPPSSQTGPVINMSTIRSWDEIGRWYRGLVAGRDKPGTALARKVDEWTAKSSGTAETVSILHEKVANLVRYVGLEFGAADYQPHFCDEVWENQYGDCKDKANLLVALLRHRGIPANIALVNTQHLGLVDHRTPDYHGFDHAIVAVPQKGHGYLFCDPTIDFSEPGMLSPGSVDREVLVITENGAEWVRTPTQSAGTDHYQFDLKLAANGELSGWLTLTSAGYYGANQRYRFSRLDADDARSEMSKIVRGFYSGAEVVDVARPESPLHAPYIVKAYFLVPGAATTGDGKYTLAFPSSAALFTDFGDRKERDSTFFMYNDRIEVSAGLSLPPGLRPAKIPAAFQFDAAAGRSQAHWTFAKDICRTSLEIEIKRTSLKPAEFGAFYQSFEALHAWLAEPVVLTRDSKLKEQPVATRELDLPMLPSGDGELDLVDKRYPESGDQEMRRLALERTIQYFSQDKPTVFRAGVRLAVIDWDANHPQLAHDRLSAILAAYAGLLKPETYSWAEALDGEVLRDLNRLKEAQDLLERVARDQSLSDGRRAGAASSAVDLMMTRSPQDALALLRQIALLPDGSTAGVESRIAHLLLLAEQNAELRQSLSHLVQSHPDSSEELLTSVLTVAQGWKMSGDGARIQALAEMVAAVQSNPGDALGKAIASCRGEGVMRQIHERLVGLVAAKPLSSWYTAETGANATSLADFKSAIDAAAAKSDPVKCLQLSLQSLVSHGTDDDFPERLWDAAGYADWIERKDAKLIDEKVATQLLDLCDQLPRTHAYYLEGKLLRAKRLARGGNVAAEQAILREILALPELPPNFLSPTCKRLGASLEAASDFRGALDSYRQAEPAANDYATAANCLLRAVFINLHLGTYDEALRLIRLLEKVPVETVKASEAEAQIHEFVALARSGRAIECWEASRVWWPDWVRFASSVGAKPEGSDQIVPVIPNLIQLGTALGGASKSGNAGDYFEQLAVLVSAARWLPSLAPEVASTLSMTSAMVPARGEEFRRLLLALLSTPHPSEIANLRMRQLLLAANLFDAGKAKESLQVTATFEATKQPVDEMTRAMHRVGALDALGLGQGVAASAVSLEADLSDPKAGSQRVLSISLLSDLYRRLGRNDDDEKLLKREMENPAIVADANARATLAKRYEQSSLSRDFSPTVDAWVKSGSLPWYDYAEPKSLDDPRLRDLESILSFPQKTFRGAEIAKLQLLAARDERRPLAARQDSLREGIRLILGVGTDYRRMNVIAASVIENKAFDDETRLEALMTVLLNFADEGRLQDYNVWRKNSLCGRFGPDFQKRLLLLDGLAAVDRTSAPAIRRFADTITAEELTPFGLRLAGDALSLQLRLGDIAGAEALTATVPDWKLSENTGTRNETVQLECARRIRIAKATNAVHEAFLAVARARFPQTPRDLPAEYQERRIVTKLPLLSREVTFQACLHLIGSRQFNRENFDFWQTFLQTLPHDADAGAIIGEMARAGLGAATDDELRSEIFNLFFGSVDLDDAKLRHEVDAAIAPFHQEADYPLSNLVFRVYEVTVATRLGELVNFETALANVNNPVGNYIRQNIRIRAYTQRGDRVALKRVIDHLDTDFLINPYFVSGTIPALEFLGYADELKVARDVAVREMRWSVVESWATGDEAAGGRALKLALVLGDSAALPAAWVADMSNFSGNPMFRSTVIMDKACLESDWAGMEKQAALLNRDFPTHYYFFWSRGFALAKLGRKEEAIAALLNYTRYSKDELEYPKAIELLKTLGGETPTPAAKTP